MEPSTRFRQVWRSERICRQFGQVGEIRTEPSTRSRRVWRSECIFVVSLGRSGRFVQNLARGFGGFGARERILSSVWGGRGDWHGT